MACGAVRGADPRAEIDRYYGDIPRLADTDCNGHDEMIVYRPGNGGWYNLDRWTLSYWGTPA